MKNRTLKVGDLVITHNAGFFTEYDGCVGVVTHSFQYKYVMDLNSMRKVYVYAYGGRPLVPHAPQLWYKPWQLTKIDGDVELSDEEQEIVKSLIPRTRSRTPQLCR